MSENVNATISPKAAPVVINAPEDFRVDLNLFKALFAGAMAGAVSRTATSPLERLKIIQQVSHAVNANTPNQGALYLLRRMWREEGFLSYWKGNGTNVLRIAPYSAIQFVSNDFFKRKIMKHDADHNPYRLLLCGGLAGMLSSVCCYPLDLVRSCFTVQTDKQHYSGMADAFKSIYSRDGIRGLYRGLIPSLMGIGPYVAINFAVFDMLKQKFLPEKSDRYFDVINLGLGAIAGSCAATVTYPTDVIRRRMQLQGFPGIELPVYKNTWDCINQMYQKEGLRGFYKGLFACYLKVIPAMAIAFMTYERFRVWLKFDPPKKKISIG